MYDRRYHEYDEPSPLDIIALAAVMFGVFVLFFWLTGPAIDHEFDEMERRAHEVQNQEQVEPG